MKREFGRPGLQGLWASQNVWFTSKTCGRVGRRVHISRISSINHIPPCFEKQGCKNCSAKAIMMRRRHPFQQKSPITVCQGNLKRNCKDSQQDLHRIKQYASEIQNIFFFRNSSCMGMELVIEQCFMIDLTQFRPNLLCSLTGGFLALTPRILKKVFSESLEHSL